MRKIFLGSAVLLFLSVTVIIFQFSCSIDADAHGNNYNDGKSILYRRVAPTGETELWAMDIDGGNRHKINIVLPPDYYLEGARVADNGNKIVLVAVKLNETENFRTIYKCNLNGSGLTPILVGAQFEEFVLQDVY